MIPFKCLHISPRDPTNFQVHLSKKSETRSKRLVNITCLVREFDAMLWQSSNHTRRAESRTGFVFAKCSSFEGCWNTPLSGIPAENECEFGHKKSYFSKEHFSAEMQYNGSQDAQ